MMGPFCAFKVRKKSIPLENLVLHLGSEQEVRNRKLPNLSRKLPNQQQEVAKPEQEVAKPEQEVAKPRIRATTSRCCLSIQVRRKIFHASLPPAAASHTEC